MALPVGIFLAALTVLSAGASAQDWKQVPSIPTSANLNGVWGRSSSDVFVAGDGGTILHYDGMGWSLVPAMHLPAEAQGVDFNAVWGLPGHAYVVGKDFTVVDCPSIDCSGSTLWTKLAVVGFDPTEIPLSLEIEDIWVDSANGELDVVAGNHALGFDPTREDVDVWVTHTFPSQTFQAVGNLNGIYGFKGGNVHLAGEERMYLALVAGGLTFLRDGGNSLGATDVWGADATELWNSGEVVKRYQQSNSRWSVVPDVTVPENTNAIFGAAADEIYQVGENAAGTAGTIWKYDGADWALQEQTTQPMNDVWIAGAGVGFAVGDGGTIYVLGVAVPTPVATPSATLSATPMPTATPLIATPTSTPTETATSTPTETASASPTTTGTATQSPSPSTTGTHTATPSPTYTTTRTPTVTPTVTPTATTAATASPSATPTVEVTPDISVTPVFPTPTRTSTPGNPTQTSTPTPTRTPLGPGIHLDIHPIQVIQLPPADEPEETIPLIREKSTMVRVFVTWNPLPQGTRRVRCLLDADGVKQTITADLHFRDGKTFVVPVDSLAPFAPDLPGGIWDAFNFEFPDTLGHQPMGDEMIVEARLEELNGEELATTEETFALRQFTDANGDGRLIIQFLRLETDDKRLSPRIDSDFFFQMDQMAHLVAGYPVPHTKAFPIPGLGLWIRTPPLRNEALISLVLQLLHQSLDEAPGSDVIDRYVLVVPGQTATRTSLTTDIATAIDGPAQGSVRGLAFPAMPRMVLVAQSAAEFTTAHENGHQLGLIFGGARHNDVPADDGWDVRHVSFIRPIGELGYRSFMATSSVRSFSWVQESEYRQLIDIMTSGGRQRQRSTSAQQPLIFVSGIKEPDGTLTLERFFTSFGQPDVIEPGAYEVQAVDGNETVLSSMSFDPAPSPHGAGMSALFGFYAPFPEGSKAIRFTKDGVVVARREVSDHPPTLEVTSLQALGDARYRVELESNDADGDELQFAAAYTADGELFTPIALEVIEDGSVFEFDGTMLAGSDSGRVRVTVTDGIWAARDVSPSIPFPGHDPIASVGSPQPAAIFSEGFPVALRGAGFDPEEGVLPPTALVWSSDRDGELGTGPSIDVADLSPGAHTVTLTVQSGDGATGMQTVPITVLPDTDDPDTRVVSVFADSGPVLSGSEALISARIGRAGPSATVRVTFRNEEPDRLLGTKEVLAPANSEIVVSQPATFFGLGSRTVAVDVAAVDGIDGDASNNMATVEIDVRSPFACPGDCDLNGAVGEEDLRRGIAALFDDEGVAPCPVFDADGSGSITASDVVAALANTRGCD